MRRVFLVGIVSFVSFLFQDAGLAFSQSTAGPNLPIGDSPSAAYQVGEFDRVDPVSGNVYLNLPLVSFPQRGHQLRLTFRIYYNDKKWFVYNPCDHTPSPQNPCGAYDHQWTWTGNFVDRATWPAMMGVYVARDQHLDFGYDTVTSGYNGNNEGGAPGGGSGYQQYFSTAKIYSAYVGTPDGAKHYVADSAYYSCSAQGGGSCPTIPFYPSESYPANDGSGYTQLPPSGSCNNSNGLCLIVGTGSAVGPDGVTYSVNLGNLMETVADTSGNKIIQTANGWVDSLNRPIPGSQSGVGTPTAIDSISALYTDPIPGVQTNGAPSNCPSGTTQAREWDVPSYGGQTQAYYLCYKSFSYQTAFGTGTEASGSSVLMNAIVLPNGTSYQFDYDNYLSLRVLTLPTGAVITYGWQNLPFPIGAYPGPSDPITRAIQSRTVDPGNGQPSRTWHYVWYPSGNGSTYAVTTDPQGNDTERQLGGTDYLGQNWGNGLAVSFSQYSGCSPHDQSGNCSGTGTLLRSEQYGLHAYGGPVTQAGASAAPTQRAETSVIVTTLPTSSGNLVSKRVMTYAPDYGSCTIQLYPGAEFNGGTPNANPTTYTPCSDANQVTQVDDYDFGGGAPGALLKSIVTRYEWQNDAGQNGSGYPACQNNGQSGYLPANFLELPQCDVTLAGTGDAVAAGTPVTETDYAYDGQNSPTGALGNQTSVSRGLSSGQVTVSTKYNSQGMPVLVTDGRGNSTQLNYDNSGLFLSSVQRPTTANGAQHTDSYSFDLNTGNINSHTDENQQTTSYVYTTSASGQFDPLNRLHQIIYPSTINGSSGAQASGYTKYDYNDQPGSLQITTSRLMGGSSNSIAKSSVSYDGLGESLSTTLSDSQGNVYSQVDQQYDVLGHVYSVSNPYLSVADTSYGLTTFIYDALGRITSKTNPDTSVFKTSYSGNAITDVDEAGVSHVRSSDALGRLTTVLENAGGFPTCVPRRGCNYNPNAVETDYTYGALGNLQSVIQYGKSGETALTRSFTYDSLSRLVTSTNPETGTICYGYTNGSNCVSAYDGNGNLLYKTDANSTGTQYNYDVLNRLIRTTFTDGSLPRVYSYDGRDESNNPLPAPYQTNANGRLSEQTDDQRNTSLLAYDALGRIAQRSDCVNA